VARMVLGVGGPDSSVSVPSVGVRGLVGRGAGGVQSPGVACLPCAARHPVPPPSWIASPQRAGPCNLQPATCSLPPPLRAGLATARRELEVLRHRALRDASAVEKKEDELRRFEVAIRNSDREIAARGAELGTPLQVGCSLGCSLGCWAAGLLLPSPRGGLFACTAVERLLGHTSWGGALTPSPPPPPPPPCAPQDGLTSEDRAALVAAQARASELEREVAGLQGSKDEVCVCGGRARQGDTHASRPCQEPCLQAAALACARPSCACAASSHCVHAWPRRSTFPRNHPAPHPL
jgi:hypothetical protein